MAAPLQNLDLGGRVADSVFEASCQLGRAEVVALVDESNEVLGARQADPVKGDISADREGRPRESFQPSVISRPASPLTMQVPSRNGIRGHLSPMTPLAMYAGRYSGR
jgi:hypothetical protein